MFAVLIVLKFKFTWSFVIVRRPESGLEICVKIHGSKLLLLSLRAGSKTIFVVAIFVRKAYGIITISCNKSNE